MGNNFQSREAALSADKRKKNFAQRCPGWFAMSVYDTRGNFVGIDPAGCLLPLAPHRGECDGNQTDFRHPCWRHGSGLRPGCGSGPRAAGALPGGRLYRNTTDERVKLSRTEDGEMNRPDNWHGQGRKAA